VKLDASLSQLWSAEEAGWSITLPDGWGQGRAVFGGIGGALSASLGRKVVAPKRKLRTASFQMMRPLSAGPVLGEVELVREGKTTSFVEARLISGGKASVHAQLVYVAARPTALAVEADPSWVGRDGPPVDELATMPVGLPGMPEFLAHLEMRWVTDSLPYSASDQARLRGYFRFRRPVADDEGLLALLDVWPCPSLALLKGPVPASTVSWTAHLVDHPLSFEGWFAYEYETVSARDGFHTVVGRMHDPQGRLVGWSEQLVALFD
jgi:acyl-CoA thioesterase